MICRCYGILSANGIYCPIDLTDSTERIVSLLDQIGGQYVLLHQKTQNQFPSATVPCTVLLDGILLPVIEVEEINDLPVCKEYGAAYIICKSDTSERPKIVAHTHKCFAAYVLTFVQWDVEASTFRDRVLQVPASSSNLHLIEISIPLVLGGTLVLLRPGGHSDMHQQWVRFTSILGSFHTRLLTRSNTSESNSAHGCHLLGITDPTLSIGCPLLSIQCLLIDEYGRIIRHSHNPSYIGQIYIC
ncbi:unnamed protein product, partial [Rotaria sp. Silwood1]